ncbi:MULTISPECIES: DUF3540 domain-containing protein [Caballeronia]|uniref:DUF3540 domain-containing protein n=1 Tax=Caballeronia TaxID=1827195 RepID=UPI001FD327A4|nr:MULTISPECIES: DUF3540 domain-containing protein [Caballeronia]MDR5799178.1 DUF3540 domain-containing protein [Caballeronia sp. LZ001]
MKHNNLVPMMRAGNDEAASLVYATVTGRAGQWYFLSAADGSLERALRADSCLVEPDCGDSVLVCHAGANVAAYVLAVLARAAADSADLVLPGGVALHAAQGGLTIDAVRIRMNASAEVAIAAPRVAVEGVIGDLAFDRMNLSIRETAARLGIVRTVAQQVTSTVGRLVQKARTSFRWTEDIDETRAGRVRMQVEERLHVTAQHASVLAEGHVRIDGEKIDLG